MSSSRIERRLADLGDRLRSLRAEAAVNAEQLEQLGADADDARLRALVSETPLAARAHHEAVRHFETLDREHRAVLAEIARLEHRQDELLDELVASSVRR